MNNHHSKIQIKISHRTMPEIIANLLRDAILSGEIKGGTPLRQEELAARFGVSMSPLREALKSLEGEGLVKFYPNRGAVVSELSAAEAREIFDIRLFLELGALELALPNLTGENLERARQILDQTDVETCCARWGEMNWRFHETIYLPAERPRLLALIQTLHNNAERYMRLYLSAMNYQAKSQAEHRELLQACVQKNVQAAQRVLRKHMEDASAVLVDYLKDKERIGG
ncbi:GntR family transcriptional regulator [Desulforamulus ruminis]|uniref:GntR domain protein n=1 Tax=Desulforamulus ruminis (strain ATCC 23193 / DSM 2154 / NCIMB 8452 / DL) TaxID=696281 RepID=F6DKM0_DESRL|nr:GntR family transcriptional regulator [Desulforamulus ruminis]AEG60395.1 GntR domain protein [Desulforamulus ruminis DSM 2154]